MTAQDAILFTPIGDRVLVKPYNTTPVSDTGITLTDQAPPIAGHVVKLGAPRCPACDGPLRFGVEVGALVTFPKEAGLVVTLEDETYYIVRGDDITGEVLPEDDEERDVTHG